MRRVRQSFLIRFHYRFCFIRFKLVPHLSITIRGSTKSKAIFNTKCLRKKKWDELLNWRGTPSLEKKTKVSCDKYFRTYMIFQTAVIYKYEPRQIIKTIRLMPNEYGVYFCSFFLSLYFYFAKKNACSSKISSIYVKRKEEEMTFT